MLSDLDYKGIAERDGLNVFAVAEMDADYNTRKVVIHEANPTGSTYSVAKLFTATAVGMAFDRGLVRPEDKLVDILGELVPSNIDDKWNRVTVDHLLTHRAGLPRYFLDVDQNDVATFGTTDYLAYALTHPLDYEPGTDAAYSDGAFYLLSRVVARVTGQEMSAFLRPTLMKTMAFQELGWSFCPEGYALGGSGMFIRVEDMVKLGVLYLNRGLWKGTRILSETWVKLALEHGYGLRALPGGWYGKGGMCGQMLLFNPEKQLAVAWMGHTKSGAIFPI